MTESLVSSDGTGQIVTAGWLMRVIGASGIRIVDARPIDQFAGGHIPRAAHSDQNLLRMPDSSATSIARYQEIATAEARRLGLEQSDKVVFYDEFSGASAARGVWMLDYLGLEGGAMLDGGLAAWIESGGEITRDVASFTPSSIETTPDASVLATAGEILKGVSDADSGVAILDTRSDLEHRTGTIPTAIQVEWLHNLDARGKFRARAELEALYHSNGFDPASDDAIVPFCGSGYRAAHAYVVLRALGYKSVKNYVPSWGEWGRRPDLPVERPGLG